MSVVRAICFAIFCCTATLAVAKSERFEKIPAAQRRLLSERLNAFLKANRQRDWASVYTLASDKGRGGVSRDAFVSAMKAEHGTDFASYPDLLEFSPAHTYSNGSGFDIYGCGKATREGEVYNGIAVMHLEFEHQNWFITGWTFTTFPNQSCEALSDPKWKPATNMNWNRPFGELHR